MKAIDYLRAGNDSLVCNIGNGQGFSVLEMIEAARRPVGSGKACGLLPEGSRGPWLGAKVRHRRDHPLCLEVASEPSSRVGRLAHQTIGIFGKQKDSPHGAIQTPRGGSFREVSIHAPAWGATRVPQEYRHWSGISIHAPAWGATDALLADFQESILFQSTHPRGVRLLVMVMGCALNVFQSTHPRGVRRYDKYVEFQNSDWFQSTHPRGVRLP